MFVAVTPDGVTVIVLVLVRVMVPVPVTVLVIVLAGRVLVTVVAGQLARLMQPPGQTWFGSILQLRGFGVIVRIGRCWAFTSIGKTANSAAIIWLICSSKRYVVIGWASEAFYLELHVDEVLLNDLKV